ncbi:MAG TPA: helix-turn-helix transcriptional regulator [Geminicoccaceae bacterium]|nr:helix-turn-helix transcriptional regulator [Geminicoccaceae bacterium]
MFTHDEVWRGIDRLARHHGLTASGLARRAGLDPTTFNPSKRITKEDKPRWPSTESLAKILTATETPFREFVAMMSDEAGAKIEPPSQRMRCVALDQAHRSSLFDQAGFPVGGDWDEIDFPNLDDPHAYAVEIHGDAMVPIYRDGDLLVASPGASIRRHDRVLLKPIKGPLSVGLLLRRTAQRVEIAPLAHNEETRRYAVGEVSWLARIVWASQ